MKPFVDIHLTFFAKFFISCFSRKLCGHLVSLQSLHILFYLMLLYYYYFLVVCINNFLTNPQVPSVLFLISVVFVLRAAVGAKPVITALLFSPFSTSFLIFFNLHCVLETVLMVEIALLL